MFDERPLVPADQGLSTLGLILKLAGTSFAAAAALLLLVTISDRGDIRVVIVCALSIVRSILHDAAGTGLLYGSRRRLRGVRRYVAAALVHAVIAGVLLHSVEIAIALMLWPLCLAFVAVRFAHFDRLVPLAEDKGFEGASILMTVLGLCGLACTLSVALALVELGDFLPGLITVFAIPLLLLGARSVLHVQAGLAGLRETDLERAVERVKRYANFGVTTALTACGLVLLAVISGPASVFGIAITGLVCWMLLAWPLIIRGFYADRQIEDLLAGDLAHRRAPDAGLTSLGWLLVAHATFTATLLSLGIPASIPLLVLELGAGVSLVRMSGSSRAIATAFGIAGSLYSMYTYWPLTRHIHNQRELAMLGPLVLAMIIPAVTLVLVHRKLTPTARARYRT